MAFEMKGTSAAAGDQAPPDLMRAMLGQMLQKDRWSIHPGSEARARCPTVGISGLLSWERRHKCPEYQSLRPY